MLDSAVGEVLDLQAEIPAVIEDIAYAEMIAELEGGGKLPTVVARCS